MVKLILHKEPLTNDQIQERRLLENLKLTPQERFHNLFELMQLSLMLKGAPLKKPQGLGVVLTREKS
jgi:hypothetical protein